MGREVDRGLAEAFAEDMSVASVFKPLFERDNDTSMDKSVKIVDLSRKAVDVFGGLKKHSWEENRIHDNRHYRT